MEAAIKELSANIENWLTNKYTPRFRGTQIMNQCAEFLQNLQGGKWGAPSLSQLQLAGLLHIWLENPDNNTPLHQWVDLSRKEPNAVS